MSCQIGYLCEMKASKPLTETPIKYTLSDHFPRLILRNSFSAWDALIMMVIII